MLDVLYSCSLGDDDEDSSKASMQTWQHESEGRSSQPAAVKPGVWVSGCLGAADLDLGALGVRETTNDYGRAASAAPAERPHHHNAPALESQ